MQKSEGWGRKGLLEGIAWRRVNIKCEPVEAKEPGQRAWSAAETKQAYVAMLKRHFPRGPGQAARAEAAYFTWEEQAERLGLDPPVSDAAKPWKGFMDAIDVRRAQCAAKGEIWAHVDAVDGIDFRLALERSRNHGRSV